MTTQPKQLTLRSALKFIAEHPECTVNDVLQEHGMPLDSRLDDVEYLDRESTGAAILEALHQRGHVTYRVTSWDGWKYSVTAEGLKAVQS